MKSLRVVCVALFTISCIGADKGVAGDEQAVSIDNGRSLNGRSLNGRSLNGRSLNGRSLNGVTLNGRSLNGAGLDGSELVAGELRGIALVGATADLALAEGDSLPLEVAGAWESGGLWFYDLVVRDEEERLCADGAILLSGRWDEREGVPGGGGFIDDGSLTVACRGATLAKCVELGYRPWAGQRELHQACVRALRADYCGDGRPGTLDGWEINLYDSAGIQVDDQNGAAWIFEAEWTADGAVCLAEARVLELVIAGAVPDCVVERMARPCGAGVLTTEAHSAGYAPLVARLVAASPGTPLADKVEDALALLERGFADLAATPPRLVDALGAFEGAAGDLEAAVADRLLATGYGRGLMTRVAGVARAQIVRIAGATTCASWSKRLAAADALRAAARYKDAIAAYRALLDGAAQAARGRCN